MYSVFLTRDDALNSEGNKLTKKVVTKVVSLGKYNNPPPPPTQDCKRQALT